MDFSYFNVVLFRVPFNNNVCMFKVFEYFAKKVNVMNKNELLKLKY